MPLSIKNLVQKVKLMNIFWSCLLVSIMTCSEEEIIQAQADIANIEQISPTGVRVEIEVFSNGHADMCQFAIALDTLKISFGSPRVSVTRESNCNLLPHYYQEIEGLKERTTFNFQILEAADLDTRGTTLSGAFFIGSIHDFTLK
jgi:hypothetical protein